MTQPTEWTKELVERLARYINASRRYTVKYHNDKVFGIDLSPAGEPWEQAAIYMTDYDDARPDTFLTPADTDPTDFVVYSLAPVAWGLSEPDLTPVDE
jgi:hypothetical protein